MSIKYEGTGFYDLLDPLTGIYRVVLIDFWAEWCGPCKTFGPVLDRYVELDANAESVLIKVNVDEHPELSAAFGISSIPTVLVYVDGEPRETLVGVRPLGQLTHELTALLAE